MCVNLLTKFQDSSIILTSFRRRSNFTPLPSISKPVPKSPPRLGLKKLFTTSYDEKTYKHAVDLQTMKLKTSIEKKQLIFLERCIKNNILPKSFRLKDCSKKLVVLVKNNAKQRMYSRLKKLNYI